MQGLKAGCAAEILAAIFSVNSVYCFISYKPAKTVDYFTIIDDAFASVQPKNPHHIP
jgi:hypothetical protein